MCVSNAVLFLLPAAMIEPKHLLIDVLRQVIWFDGNVCAAQSAFQVDFQKFSISLMLHLTVNVPLGVIHEVMHEARVQIVVSCPLVGEHAGAVLHFAHHFGL